MVAGESLEIGARMRKPVANIYNRQVAKCLHDIEAVYELPAVVIDRIKKAIEYTAKDIDKINKLNRNPNGEYNEQETDTAGNR
jgi:hypothetical protein